METEEISAFFNLETLSRSSSNQIVLIENQALYDDVCEVLALPRNHGLSCIEIAELIASACGFAVFGSSSYDGSAIHHPTVEKTFDEINRLRYSKMVTPVDENEISAVLARCENTVEILFQKTGLRLPYAAVYVCSNHEIDSICERMSILMSPGRTIREITEGASGENN